MKRYILLSLTVLIMKSGFGQAIPRFNPDTLLTVVIDSVVAIKTARGLSADLFIERILNDTSFYEAFRNMKKYDFIAENSIYTYDKKDKINGSMYRKIRHTDDGENHKMEYLDKKDTGKLHKKNGKYSLLTVQMFDYIFMNAYNSDFVPASENSSPKKSKFGSNEFYKEKLKTLVFTPGRPIKGVPIISGKTEIFTPNMKQYYDYTYSSGTYLDSIPVYRFKVTQKEDLSNWIKSGIMIKELTTIFDKRDLQILGRYIDMKLNNMAFSFDVQMNIEMRYFKEDLLPTKISYQGNWDIPFKKEERASFLVLHKNYK